MGRRIGVLRQPAVLTASPAHNPPIMCGCSLALDLGFDRTDTDSDRATQEYVEYVQTVYY
jgi:hypothetical protein